MALTERVVLFHDFVPHGVAQTEVLRRGHRRGARRRGCSLMHGVDCGWVTGSGCRCWPADSRRPAAWCSTTSPGWRSPRTVAAGGRARPGHRRPHRAARGGMTSSAPEAQAGDQPAQGPQAPGPRHRRSVPGPQRGADRRRGALHVPVPRRRRRGPARAARGRAARADPDAQAAGHGPVVPRSRAARGLPGQLPARGAPRRARRAIQRSAQPQALLQPRGHVLGVFRARLPDPGVDGAGSGGTPGHSGRDRRCRVEPCGATAR